MSKSNLIENASNFNFKTGIKYGQVKTQSTGARSIDIKNKRTSQKLYLQTPLMLTWGVSDYDGNEKYDMTLSFLGDNGDPPRSDVVAFQNNMKMMEEQIKTDALANSQEWFGKKYTNMEVLDALWTPILKYPKVKGGNGELDYDRTPNLRIKLPIWDGEWKSKLYDTDKKQIFPNDDGTTPVDIVQKGSRAACVIESGGIWYASGKFGVTWRLKQAIVKSREDISDVCQIDLGDDEKKSIDTSAVAAQSNDESDDEVQATVEDDDDDDGVEEEEEEEEEVAPPPPPVKKKRVIKKKAVTAEA
jgi:hypothetical protein